MLRRRVGGLGILVNKKRKWTKASYSLENPAQVMYSTSNALHCVVLLVVPSKITTNILTLVQVQEFLQKLVSWKKKAEAEV